MSAMPGSSPAPASSLRRVVSALVPDSGKRMIDAARNRYSMAVMAPANREFVRRHGRGVTSGPFTGMQYLPGLEPTQGDLVGKLLGIYESELHGAVGRWSETDLTTIVNVGCAEGYYAVGLALAVPSAAVLAYDIDPTARELCSRLAALNNVADRVQVNGECTPQTLAALPASGVGLLCDCEGYEKTLLDPELAPTLRGWSIIVELHDFVDPTITDTIRQRFDATHEIELIRSTVPGDPPAEVSFMTDRQRRLVLNERPVPMTWASLAPRS